MNLAFFYFCDAFEVCGSGQTRCCSQGSYKSHAGVHWPAVGPCGEQSAHLLQRARPAYSPALSLFCQSRGATRIRCPRDSPRHPAETRGAVGSNIKCENLIGSYLCFVCPLRPLTQHWASRRNQWRETQTYTISTLQKRLLRKLRLAARPLLIP